MIKELKETLLDENHNITFSENGAVMYETSGRNLLDLYWKIPSLRALNPGNLYEIEGVLTRAMMENKKLFAKFLFFLRDVRGGVGERNSFRNIYLWYLRIDRTNAVRLLPLVPEFGRWDDLVWLLCNYNYEEADLSRTNAIPLKENECGVILMSGYSVALCKMALSNETDPYKALVRELECERYSVIEAA